MEFSKPLHLRSDVRNEYLLISQKRAVVYFLKNCFLAAVWPGQISMRVGSIFFQRESGTQVL